MGDVDITDKNTDAIETSIENIYGSCPDEYFATTVHARVPSKILISPCIMDLNSDTQVFTTSPLTLEQRLYFKILYIVQKFFTPECGALNWSFTYDSCWDAFILNRQELPWCYRNLLASIPFARNEPLPLIESALFSLYNYGLSIGLSRPQVLFFVERNKDIPWGLKKKIHALSLRIHHFNLDPDQLYAVERLRFIFGVTYPEYSQFGRSTGIRQLWTEQDKSKVLKVQRRIIAQL
jgi:hypothetical protein